MKQSAGSVRLPLADDLIAPVTIFDAEGHVVRVVAASDFRGATQPEGEAPRHPSTLRRERKARGTAA